MFHDFFVCLFFFLNQGRGKATPKRRGVGGGGGTFYQSLHTLFDLTWTFIFQDDEATNLF